MALAPSSAPPYKPHTIAAYVAEHDIKIVITDSAAGACSGDLSSREAADTLQRALRKNCASLVLAHTSKSVQEGQERTAYGTVFLRELGTTGTGIGEVGG